MNILVCIKRVPAPGAKMVLTPDAQEIETRFLGFTMSPHEECGVEEAVQLNDKHGGSTTVLTLGPADAADQLRYSMSMGIDRAVHLETDGSDWEPIATARAITASIRSQEADGDPFDLMIFGNESADSGGYQVGIRVAHALGVPCITGIKEIEIDGNKLIAKREMSGGWEIFEVPMPAIVTVKEGINLPRYPSVPGRLRAKRKKIETSTPEQSGGGLEKIRLVVPQEEASEVEILGNGPDAASKVVDILKKLELV